MVEIRLTGMPRILPLGQLPNGHGLRHHGKCSAYGEIWTPPSVNTDKTMPYHLKSAHWAAYIPARRDSTSSARARGPCGRGAVSQHHDPFVSAPARRRLAAIIDCPGTELASSACPPGSGVGASFYVFLLQGSRRGSGNK